MDESEVIRCLRRGWRTAVWPEWHLRGSPEEIARLDAAFEDVRRRHSEPTRHYHGLDHVDAVLEALPPDVVPLQVRLAAFLHDVIYDSRAKDNEERSAEYAHEVLASLGVDRDVREEVARLILLTKKHETSEDDADGQILLDADLAILGADEAEYDRYAAAIRREYAWVGDEDYRAGRREVLKRFLARPRLYFTDSMRERYEAKARANLAREIAALGG